MLKIKLFVLMLFIGIANASSQGLCLKHFTVDDGLPSNTIFSLYFDSNGYLWIGTDKGLTRYNGIEFKTFTTNNGLPDNEIFGVSEDLEGRLWVSNFKGVLCYYKDNIFHTAKNSPWLKLKWKSSSNFFSSLQLQKDSSMLTESMDGKMLLYIKHEAIKEISTEKIYNSVDITDQRALVLRKLNDNSFQLFHTHKWFIIDTLSNIVKTQFYKDTSSHYPIYASGKIILGTAKAAVTPDEKFLTYLPKDGPVGLYLSKILYIQDPSNIFTLSKYGLYHNSTQLLGENYTFLNPDNAGNLWIGSTTDGIYALSKYFQNSFYYPDKLNEKIVASRFIGDDICLVGEAGNTFLVSGKKKSITTIKRKSATGIDKYTRANTYILPSGDIVFFSKYGFFHKKSGSNTYRKLNFETDTILALNSVVKSIDYIDSTLLISTIIRVVALKLDAFLKPHAAKIKEPLLLYSTSLQDRIYHSALRLSDTSLWFSQLDKMSHVKNKIVTQEKELQNNTFRQFAFLKDYLIGNTDENKFLIYNTRSKKTDSIVQPDCIWETLYTITDSTAIISTDNSYKLLTLHAAYKNGQPNYNLITVESPFIPQKADYIFGNGATYYFVKNGYLSEFPAEMVMLKPRPPKPIFVSVKTAEKEYAAAPVLKLPYNQSKTVSIQIHEVSFNDKEVVTQYSISKDENDNWNAISGNEINLNNIGIGYGTYTIKLRSKTRASNFSIPAVMIMQITTPFWAQWWFIALSAIAILLLILAIIRLIIWHQVRKRQKEFDAEMKYQQSEYKALNALMNPHFIFNSLNNIQSLINKDHKETANQYLVIFSKLIRQNMLNVSKGYISLYQEMILIENYLYLEKLRFKELINFTVNIDEEIDTETVMIPPLLIQPVVENAIIHGLLPMQSEDSQLSIRIFEIEEVIHVEIIDNGVGLDQSLKKKNAESDSYGLSNLHRRIEHVKKFQKSNIEFQIKELVDENGKTLGTQANITIEQL